MALGGSRWVNAVKVGQCGSRRPFSGPRQVKAAAKLVKAALWFPLASLGGSRRVMASLHRSRQPYTGLGGSWRQLGGPIWVKEPYWRPYEGHGSLRRVKTPAR
ncbi:hypothetical protein ACLB2K_017911 [Fragaria x ananassa]